MVFESIPLHKKDQMRLCCRVGLQLVLRFSATKENYNYYISMLYSFVAELLSIPSILRYLSPLLVKDLPLSSSLFKDIFQAYYHSKLVDMDKKEQQQKL